MRIPAGMLLFSLGLESCSATPRQTNRMVMLATPDPAFAWSAWRRPRDAGACPGALDLTGLVTPELPRTSAADRAYWAGQDVAGGQVVLGPVVRDTSQILETVALGQTVALIPESLATGNVRDDVVYRPVLDATPYVLAVAWPAGSRDQRTAQFVRTAVELTATNQSAMHILREVSNPTALHTGPRR